MVYQGMPPRDRGRRRRGVQDPALRTAKAAHAYTVRALRDHEVLVGEGTKEDGSDMRLLVVDLYPRVRVRERRTGCGVVEELDSVREHRVSLWVEHWAKGQAPEEVI